MSCGPEVHQHDQRDAASSPEPTVGETDAIDRGVAILCGFVRRHGCWSRGWWWLRDGRLVDAEKGALSRGAKVRKR